MNARNPKATVLQNEAKYKNARISLLMIVLFSALNVLTIYFAGSYFLFSSYVSQLLASVGYFYYYATGLILYPLISVGLCVAVILPYLLCWIFSKKHVGWMVAALVLFSVDSLIFSVDFVPMLMAGDVSVLIDLVFRVWALVSLILGVRYGFKRKELAAATLAEVNGEECSSEAETETEEDIWATSRTLTLNRKKRFVACAVSFTCYVNDVEIGKLQNGGSLKATVPGGAFLLTVSLTNGYGAGGVTVPAGEGDLSYQVMAKMGGMSSSILITPEQ